jgi:hypothetical protein
LVRRKGGLSILPGECGDITELLKWAETGANTRKAGVKQIVNRAGNQDIKGHTK